MEMQQKTNIKKLREFLSIERDKAQEKLAQYSADLPPRNKDVYTQKETIQFQLFSATLWKIQTYSEIIDIIKVLEGE